MLSNISLKMVSVYFTKIAYKLLGSEILKLMKELQKEVTEL